MGSSWKRSVSRRRRSQRWRSRSAGPSLNHRDRYHRSRRDTQRRHTRLGNARLDGFLSDRGHVLGRHGGAMGRGENGTRTQGATHADSCRRVRGKTATVPMPQMMNCRCNGVRVLLRSPGIATCTWSMHMRPIAHMIQLLGKNVAIGVNTPWFTNGHACVFTMHCN